MKLSKQQIRQRIHRTVRRHGFRISDYQIIGAFVRNGRVVDFMVDMQPEQGFWHASFQSMRRMAKSKPDLSGKTIYGLPVVIQDAL